MSYRRKLVFFILLHLVTTQPQINLDLTNWVSNSESDVVLQHDCLHVAVPIKSKTDPQQVISYCISELPSKWNMQQYNFDQKFTFAELAKLSITSEQLYIWSAPIDVIEDYQLYLNQRSTSKELLSMATQLFYNCTSPTFGPLCQYSLDGYESFYHLSLQDIIHDFYSYLYKPTTLTCYTHVRCSDSSHSPCLDWRDICDEKIDCFNDGIDEKYCWQLQINECKDNEYRCNDGQCIPKTFVEENIVVGCIDQSGKDMIQLTSAKKHREEPTLAVEDIRCLKAGKLQAPYLNLCAPERAGPFLDAMFFDKQSSISDDCWFAFRCHFSIPNTLHPRCRDIFAKETWQTIINKTCPDILYIPNTPILFGHIYLAYTKQAAMNSTNWVLRPSYICYNDQLCSGFLPNKTLLSFNNATCRQPDDFPIHFFMGGRGDWMITYVRPIYEQLYKCNTMPQNILTLCNSSAMYRCLNSSKCISMDRIGDMASDCNYADDEKQDLINSACLTDKSGRFYHCETTKKCIHQITTDDRSCDCGWNEYAICEDKNMLEYQITTHISFPTICNGFTELAPINISERNETDETECDLWHCNNTYTRCDGFWNCFNGADEVDCEPSPLLNCQAQHVCISPNMTQLMCLSLSKVNDGNIDCLGDADEPDLCRSNNVKHNEVYFSCKGKDEPPCTWSRYLCDEIEKCEYGDDSQFCVPSRNINVSTYKCPVRDGTTYSDIEGFLCARESHKFKQLASTFFSFDGVKHSTEHSDPTIVVPTPIGSKNQRCHRGFPLRVWLDKEKNLTNTTCLCPPSFYGDICQYQNERVSLTIMFRTYSDSRRTLFAIVISLIDDGDERTIHSYQQLTYLYIRDCETKLDIYLLYSTRPKNQTKQYSIHIDIYEKISLFHRASFLIPVKYLFLPIQRVAAQIIIPHEADPVEGCSNKLCIHGRCMKYRNNSENAIFCQCEQKWSGRYCNIPHTCSCSSDSLCIGVSANNQSICVCPINMFGSRCLLHNTICKSNRNETCYNGGECIPIDENMASNKKFFCKCPKSFSGDRCEISNTKIMVSFHKDIVLPQSMMVHFIEVMNNSNPNNGTTSATISINKKSAIIYWPHPFHIAFIKLSDNNYYLIIVQKTYNVSTIIFRTVNPSDRCAHISEVLNESITQLHLIRRIKYYHVPCQNRSSNLSCFYDDTHFCLCTNFGQQRLANCFEFNYTEKFDCFRESGCLNGGECLQDRSKCPLVSVCLCPKCFYGAQCQFNSKGFGLSLDGILGYHIQPHIKLINQPLIIQISVALTIIMTIAGLIDGILSTITFKSQALQKVGCGLYLLGSSITTLLLMVMFATKFTILLIAQINYISNRSFLFVQCIPIDFLLRIGLNMNQWLNACVAIERAVTTIKGVCFDQVKSKRMAKYIIVFLLFFTTSTNIYDPFNRTLIDDGDDGEPKRIWCTVIYSYGLHVLNSFMNILHFFAPFIINIISASVIIVKTTRQRRIIHKKENFQTVLYKQIREHKHILIGPFVLIILAIPRIIISFVSGCMKTSDDAWLFLVGYFMSFIPSMLTFFVFVLPSKSYKEQFLANVKQYRTYIQTRLRRNLIR